MPVLQQYLFVIGSFQGLLLASLLIFDRTLSNASRILGAWCLFLALSFLGPFITIDGQLNVFSPLIGLSFFLPASYGAFIYLYCRHAILDRPLAWVDLWHFSPLLLCYLLNFDLFLAPPQAKLDAVLGGEPDTLRFAISNFLLFSQAFIYLGFSARLIRNYQRQARQTLSGFNPGVFDWLWKLLILDLTIWSLKLLGTVIIDSHALFITADVLIIVLIYSIAMAQWRNPTLFKVEQLTSEPADDADADSESDAPARGAGALDDSIKSSLLEAVKRHMQEQQTYLDNQLTLTRLAEAVGVSTHHLSEVLNQHEGKNFYQFVNEYRIDYIREQLQRDQSVKILDLAMTAGFSSKSTFNAVFKQFTGLTPSQYRRQLLTN
jgi:AraC-like DNA-binding protein